MKRDLGNVLAGGSMVVEEKNIDRRHFLFPSFYAQTLLASARLAERRPHCSFDKPVRLGSATYNVLSFRSNVTVGHFITKSEPHLFGETYLFCKMVKEIQTDAELISALSAAEGNLVVIDFFATWCAPCVKIAPFLGELSEKFKNVVFLKIDVDVDAVQESIQKHKINCMPTFVLLKDDVEVDRLEGASEEELKAKVTQHA